MKLSNKKRIVASILGAGMNRVWIDPDRVGDVKQAITKEDIRRLVNEGAIMLKPELGISKFRLRKRLMQKRKGRLKGIGRRKGKRTARLSRKRKWILNVRLQREVITGFKKKGLINNEVYKDLRKRVKGGFFRSVRHIKLYLGEHGLLKKDGKK